MRFDRWTVTVAVASCLVGSSRTAFAQTVPSTARDSAHELDAADPRYPATIPYTSFERYAVPEECASAAIWYTERSRYTVDTDTLYLGRTGRPLLQSTIEQVRSCLSRFTVESVPQRELLGLGAAYLAANQDSLAAAAFARLDQLLASAPMLDRAWARYQMVSRYLSAVLPRVEAADRVLQSLDQLGPSAAVARLHGHLAMAQLAQCRDSVTLWDRETRAALALVRQMPHDVTRDYISQAFESYVLRTRWFARQNAPDSAAAVIADAKRLLVPLQPIMMGKVQLLSTWIAMQGKPAAPVKATRWYNVTSSADTIHPASGRVSVVMFGAPHCYRCRPGYAVLRRLRAAYGASLDLVMAAQTVGYFGERLVSPDSESRLIAHYFLDQLTLPVHLAVWNTPMGRRDDDHVTVLAAPNRDAYPMPPSEDWVAVVVDRDGFVRLATEVTASNEVLLDDVIRETIAAPRDSSRRLAATVSKGDSALTMTWARQVITAGAAIDSILAAHADDPALSLPVKTTVAQRLVYVLSITPDFKATLKRLGLTPDRFTEGYRRLHAAWYAKRLDEFLRQQGRTLLEMQQSGDVEHVSPEDRKFMDEHDEELTTLGIGKLMS